MDDSQYMESIRASILSHDKLFQELMCMIPPKYYITQPQLSLPHLHNGSRKSGKKNKQSTPLIDPEAKRLKKRAQYDPDTLPTVPQLQGLNKSCGSKPDSVSQNQKPSAESSQQDDSGDSNRTALSQGPQLSRAELQAKLQQRIETLQSSSQKKNAPETDPELGEMTSKDALLALERKKRGEMRDRRRKERKEARAKEKQMKQQQESLHKKRLGSSKTSKAPGSSGNLKKNPDTSGNGGTQTSKEVLHQDDSQKSEPNEVDPVKTAGKSTTCIGESSTSTGKHAMTNQEPDLAFSALSFEMKDPSGIDSVPSHGRKNPSWTSKNPQEAKIALERRAAYLEKLTPEARERAEESKKWEKANLQASGTKVTDDPKKIEKAIKKQNKEKKKKKSQWDERYKVVEKYKEDRQKKRTENIQKRRDQIRDKKKGVKAKGNSASKSHKKPVKGF